MPNTANLGIPYPVTSDGPSIPQHMQSLAEGVDGFFAGAWTPFTLTAAGSTNVTTFGTGNSQDNAWKRLGAKTAAFRISLVLGTGATFFSGIPQLGPLPFTAAVSNFQCVPGIIFKGTSTPTPIIAYLSGTQVVRMALTSTSGFVSNTAPWTWAAGDQIRLSGTCEIA